MPVTAAAGQITGTVSHRERMALPPDAVVHVTLEETGRLDAPARTISEAWFLTGGAQSPFAYTLPFSDAAVRTGSFNVRARIWIAGKLRFASTDAYPVLKDGTTTANILVRIADAPMSLQGTKWQLVELNGRPSIGTQAFLRFDGGKRSAGGNTGVNVFGGSYTLSGNTLDISPGPQTMIAGSPELMEQERAYIAALDQVTAFRIAGSRLELIADGQVVARFRAVPGG